LQSAPATATASIAGFHLFPFGGLRRAANWLRGFPEEMLRPMAQPASRADSQNP
jgi:methylenetetrahydrofolate reductase (NADPH)